MLSASMLVVLGLALELALGIYVLVATRLETSKLSDFVGRAENDLISAVEELHEPYRTIGRPFADQIEIGDDLDDALSEAIVRTTTHPFKKSLTLRLAVGVICAFALLAPAARGLLMVANQMVNAWSDASRHADVALASHFVAAQNRMEVPFDAMRTAFTGSAMLLFGLACIAALAWYQRRPEVREARFIRALLEVASRVRRGESAPVSGRLSELIAPDRGLNRPIKAMIVCFGGITLAWVVLFRTAPVRDENSGPAVYSVWPKDAGREISSWVNGIPRAMAGAPLAKAATALTAQITPSEIGAGGRKVTYQEGWQALFEDQSFPGVESAAVISASSTRLGAVIEVLELLEGKGVGSFKFVIEREFGPQPVQAYFDVEFRPSAKPAAFSVKMNGDAIELDGARIKYDDPSFSRRLGEKIGTSAALRKRDADAVVAIDVDMNASYARLIQVMAAADGTCKYEVLDCGLPGRGVGFRITTRSLPSL